MIAVTPALAARSTLSRNGKNASDAKTDPRLRSPALRIAISTESTPTHLPRPDADDGDDSRLLTLAGSPRTIALTFDVLADEPREMQCQEFGFGRFPLGDALPFVWVVGTDIAGLHEQSAIDTAIIQALRGRRSIRRFAAVGRFPSIS